MRQIAWELEDGFPFDQGAMKFLQDEAFDRIKFLADWFRSSLGMAHFIITGMEHNLLDNTISPGWCWMNDKLLYYPGGSHPGNPAVVRPNLTETEVEYEDGVDRPAYRYWTAQIMVGGTGEGFLYASASRVPKLKELAWQNITGIPLGLVFDANYVHTDNNFTNALLNKLMGIQPGAEVNVQADWAETNPGQDSFIKNKPASFDPTLKGAVVGSYPWPVWPINHEVPVIGDFEGCVVKKSKIEYDPEDSSSISWVSYQFEVSFPPLEDSNYEIVFTNIANDSPTLWYMCGGFWISINEKTNSSFKLVVTSTFLSPIHFGINLFKL